MSATAELARPEQKPYRPYGAAEALLYDKSPEIILDGPAGTGKSRACLEKIMICADKYPGTRILIVRKTRASLTQSALVTWESNVVPAGHPLLKGPDKGNRASYWHPNGTEIVVGGLGDASEKIRIMSTEYDLIYVQEAREVSESEWEELGSRLRWGTMPYTQIIGDTNPDAPNHWIKKREGRGALKLIRSRHQDNPTITPEYLARLEALTGIRKERLYYGNWRAAEGVVYDGYDPVVHLVDRMAVGVDWPRYLAVDFGFTNPLVAQWWAMDSDGRLVRYRELYHSQLMVEDAAHEIRRLSEGERIRAIVCDHDAEDRATLQRHLQCSCPSMAGASRIGVGTTAARKDVSPGIQAVAQRLKPAGDGKPRLSLLRDSLVQRDELLAESGKPTCTEEEFEGYIWDDATKKVNPDGSYKAELPLKKDDHGMDAMRYMVAYFDLGANLGEAFLKPQPFDRGPANTKDKLPDPVKLPPQFPKLDPKKWYARG